MTNHPNRAKRNRLGITSIEEMPLKAHYVIAHYHLEGGLTSTFCYTDEGDAKRFAQYLAAKLHNATVYLAVKVNT